MGTRGHTEAGGRCSVYDNTLTDDHTTNLWKTCPLMEWLHDPSIGILLQEDWTTYDATATTGDYLLTQATTGSAAISTAASGVLEIDSDSGGAHQGAQVQRIKPAFLPAAGKHIWAEWEFNIADTATDSEVFIGLSELDATLINAGANSSANHIGWHCITGDGVMLFVGEKAGATVTGKACTTLVTGTNVKLGFYCDGVTTVQQYLNGVATSAPHVTAQIPVVALYVSFVCQGDTGAVDPIMHLKGYRVFQLR